jgi:alanyl-tRNA synthetase
MTLDREGFERELGGQRERARSSWKGQQPASGAYARFGAEAASVFLGYGTLEAEGRVLGILQGSETVERLDGRNAEAEVVLDRTPFYAEAGGQIGDTGTLRSWVGTARVLDTVAPSPGVIAHKIVLEAGTISVGDTLECRVDGDRRSRIAANHTGTHLLHAALRETLGLHVKQKGSLVAPDRLRFDYTHFGRLGEDEIQSIERIVNRVVLENLAVVTREMALDEAVEGGAIALFGEKYEQEVRVVSVGEVSMELCGGTHTRATGDIGLFKIVSEGSVAAGVRRIEALTGFGSYERLDADEHLLGAISGLLRTPRHELEDTLSRLLRNQRDLEGEVARMKRSMATSSVDSLLDARRDINDVPVISTRVDDLDPGAMRELAELLRSRLGSGVIAIGGARDDKAMLVTAVSSDLEKRFPAGKIVKAAAAIVGGSGGGRPDFAQAGGKHPEKLDEALEEVYNIVAGLSA